MADVKVIKDGSDLNNALFQNAATEETIKGFKEESSKQSRDKEKKDDERAKESNKILEQTRESGAKSAGYLAGMAGNLASILTSAYQQNIDLGDQITEIASLTGNALGGIVSGIASVAGVFGKVGKGVAKGLQATVDGAGGAISGLTEKFGEFFKGGINELVAYRDLFKDVSAAGAGFGGDLLELKGASAQMRMTIQEFNQVVRDESQQLAGIGATTSDSIKQLALFTDTFNDNMEDTVMNLMNMGYTTQEINDALRRQMTTNRRMNFEDAAVREREQKAAADLAYELDTISRLTGIQRAELQKEIDERRRKAEVEATIMQLDMDGSRGVGNAFKEAAAQVSQFGPGAVQALQEIFTQGVAHTPEAQAALTAMGSAGDELTNLALRIRQGGDQTDLGMEFVGAMMDRMNQSDFLSQVKLGPLGVEVGQAAGEFITSGGKAIYDALYQQGDDLQNLPFAERYKKAVEAVEQAREKELQDRDTNGQKLNNAFNVLEQQTRNVGVALAERTATTVNNIETLGTVIDGTAGVIKKAYTSLAAFIAPDEQLFTDELQGHMQRRKEAEAEYAKAEERRAKMEEIHLRNAEAYSESMMGHMGKIKLTDKLAEDGAEVLQTSLEYLDETFAKAGFDFKSFRESIQQTITDYYKSFEDWGNKWLADFKTEWPKTYEGLTLIKDGILGLTEILKNGLNKLLGWVFGIENFDLGSEVGVALERINQTAGELYNSLEESEGGQNFTEKGEQFLDMLDEKFVQPVTSLFSPDQEPSVSAPIITPETISGYQNMGAQMRAEQVRQEAARTAREEIEKSQAERQSDVDFLNTTTNADVVSQLKKNDERIQELIEVSKYSAGQHMEQTGYLRQTSNTSSIGSFA